MALGCPDVDAMLDGMSSRQWSEWQVFWRTYGWGERRMDVRFAQLMTLIANLVRSNDAPPVGVEAFLPDDDDDEEIDAADVGGEIVDEDQLIFEAMLSEAM